MTTGRINQVSRHIELQASGSTDEPRRHHPSQVRRLQTTRRAQQHSAPHCLLPHTQRDVPSFVQVALGPPAKQRLCPSVDLTSFMLPEVASHGERSPPRHNTVLLDCFLGYTPWRGRSLASLYQSPTQRKDKARSNSATAVDNGALRSTAH